MTRRSLAKDFAQDLVAACDRSSNPPRLPACSLGWLLSAGLGLAMLGGLNHSGLVLAQAPMTPANAPAPIAPTATAILYVNSASGADQAGAGTTAAAPYRTISFALQQATMGTVIQIAPGQYTKATGETFPLKLKPGVILKGDEAAKGEGILIQGGGTISSKTFANQNAAILAAASSEIRGVTVTNTANSRGTGVWVEDTNPTIANNTFANSTREGVFVTGAAAPMVMGNVFTKNQGNGISIDKAARGTVQDNTFSDTGFGLAIGGNAAPLVESNQITQNTDGLYLNGNAMPVLRNNTITNNRRTGIVATGAAKPDLGTSANPGRNTIRGNKQVDVNNSTRNTLIAVGNNIDPKKISGKVDFVAGSGSDVASGSPSTGGALKDVKGHWAEAYIKALSSKNIISGFPDGNFKPDAPVTRAQFATIVLKAFAPVGKKPATTFSDVPQKYWGYEAIQTSAQSGFMAGFPGGLFKPEQKIPRVQALVSLANGLEYGAGNPALLAKYQDAASIPAYGKAGVSAATQRQVVVNYPKLNQLQPNREATRAEVAAFIYQALVSAGKAQAITSPYLVVGK